MLRWGCLHVRGTATRRAGQCGPALSENGGCWPGRSATCPFRGRSSHLPQTREPETAASPARSARRCRCAGARAWRFRGRGHPGLPSPCPGPAAIGATGERGLPSRGEGTRLVQWGRGGRAGPRGRIPGGGSSGRRRHRPSLTRHPSRDQIGKNVSAQSVKPRATEPGPLLDGLGGPGGGVAGEEGAGRAREGAGRRGPPPAPGGARGQSVTSGLSLRAPRSCGRVLSRG